MFIAGIVASGPIAPSYLLPRKLKNIPNAPKVKNPALHRAFLYDYETRKSFTRGG
jgi:hypothetical protein